MNGSPDHPLRLLLRTTYALDRQKERDQPRRTTKDEFAGVLRGEYTVWKKLFPRQALRLGVPFDSCKEWWLLGGAAMA